MNQKELKELIEFLIEKDIAEFELERGDVKVRIKRAGETSAPAHDTRFFAVQAPPVAAEMAASPAAPPPPAAKEKAPAPDEKLHTVRSPIVGTFYRAPSPTADSFVRIGSQVEPSTVVCIIEAMKLMNEIQAETTGEVVKIYVENGQAVEYGQPLFGIKSQ